MTDEQSGKPEPDFNPRFHKDDQGDGPIKILPVLGACLLWVLLLPGLAVLKAWQAIMGR